MSKPKSEYSIQTVSNALRLLEAFHDEDELGVSELSRRLDLHKNNVFRLLATLEQKGFIEQSGRTERYRLGAACLRLSHAYARGRSLMRRARPLLEKLAAELGETAHLAEIPALRLPAAAPSEPQGDASEENVEETRFEVVHLDGELPRRQRIVTGLRLGERLPVHATALGKVLLGCADEASRARFEKCEVEPRGLPTCTPETIDDPAKLFEHLRTVSLEGFALDLEEFETGLSCLAAPVFDASGQVVAALSVSGPSFRMTEAHLRAVVAPAVVEAAEELSKELGYSG